MDVTITKLVHACLLVETGDRRVLLDPGGFTWQDERFDISMVEGVDRILITHEHGDHVNVDFVRAVLERSNDAAVETTRALAAILADKDVEAVTEGTQRYTSPHERIPVGPGPENTGFHVDGALSHPGDSHSFNETMPILAMPFAAPWGSLANACDRVRLVRPKITIPIHDWFLGDGGKKFWYQLAARAFEGTGIDLVVLNDFEPVELSV